MEPKFKKGDKVKSKMTGDEYRYLKVKKNNPEKVWYNQ